MKYLQEVHVDALAVERFATILGPDYVQSLIAQARAFNTRLDGRCIWHVNSTAVGGGVAEMLPSLLGYARGLGIQNRWAVIGGTTAFFRVTKRLHHALHGEPGDGSALDAQARAIYEEMTRRNAAELLALVRRGDIAVLHDPQTAGLAPYLADHGALVLWRCHIGQDERSEEADRAWAFLAPDLERAQRYLFSREEYVPQRLDHGRSSIIRPSIDPFSPKNQALDDQRVRTILVHTGLLGGPLPEQPSYAFTRTDGSAARVDRHADIIRCGRPVPGEAPVVAQISRWDPLKDPKGVMEGFTRWLGSGADGGAELILAGPAVHAVADDPEQVTVFNELFMSWCQLPHSQRCRVHLVMLPMVDPHENAAIVNALQRHATLVVQKSLKEGFGLTVAEAMWKGRPVIASGVGGIKDQIEHGVSGMLLRDPSDPAEFAGCLGRLMGDSALRARMGAAAEERVKSVFLAPRSLTDYARLIDTLELPPSS